MRATKVHALAALGAVLAFGLTFGATAQDSTTRIGGDPAASTAAAAGDTSRIHDDFVLEETVEVCAGCHGEGGVPVSDDIPALWGQQFYYLYVQMKDYKAGRRANEIMQPMVENFTRDQMKALAQYFADKTWPAIASTKDDEIAGKGRSAAAAGQCSQCHNQYLGDSRVPRVAGQQQAYLLRTMLEFKHKIRLNAPAKNSLMKSFEDSSLEDIAHFLSTL